VFRMPTPGDCSISRESIGFYRTAVFSQRPYSASRTRCIAFIGWSNRLENIERHRQSGLDCSRFVA
jgi:hypothetical protein